MNTNQTENVKSGYTKFTESDCKLRTLTTQDADIVLKWRNSDRVRKFMFTDHIITESEHLKWIKKVLADDNYDYFIFEYKAQPIGLVGFYNIDDIHNRCYWAFYIGDQNAPKGSGLVMQYFALECIFLKNTVHKLCSEAFTFNVQSIKLHNKLGFTEEGVFKKHYIKNGKPEDIASLALFNEEWKELRNKISNQLFYEK